MSDIVPDSIDIYELADSNPERAAILVDATLKKQVADEREGWIVRARAVYYLRQTGVWAHHPMNFKSLFEYCQQSEIDISPSLASDMIAVCKYADPLAAAGYDIWDVIRRTGPSKVRQIIPQVREAHRKNVLAEEVGPIIDSIENMSFREVLELTGTSGVRSKYEYEAVYRESDQGAQVTIRNLDVEDLEHLAKKIRIKRWYNDKGLRIEPPLDALPDGKEEQ